MINIENLPFSDFISKSELFTIIKNGNKIIDNRLEIIKDYLDDRPYIKPSYFEDFQKIYTNAKEISNIQSVKPKNALMLNNKLSLELTKDFINQGEQSINVVAKNKAPVTIYASMNYNDKNISLSRNFTAYDREIHNAVISLYVAGNTTFTADMVYKLLNIKDTLNNSEEITVLRNYLIRRIEVIKDNDNQGNNISYGSIFREIDINKENLTEGAYKTKTKVIRQHIKKILEYCIKNDYIKKYEDYKEDKSIIALKIHY